MTVLEKECPHCNAVQGKVEACQKGLSGHALLQNVLDIKDHVTLLCRQCPHRYIKPYYVGKARTTSNINTDIPAPSSNHQSQ